MNGTTFIDSKNMVSLSEARTKLGELVLERLPKNREIYLSYYNIPVAKIVPIDEIEARRKRMMGWLKNRKPIWTEEEGNALIKNIYRWRRTGDRKKPIKIWG